MFWLAILYHVRHCYVIDDLSAEETNYTILLRIENTESLLKNLLLNLKEPASEFES